MRIAIIGGIGSGKSEALKTVSELGICTLSADEINAELMRSEHYVNLLAEAFPTAVHSGIVDRKALAQIVFSSDGELEKLNAIAHPCILGRIAEEKADPLVVEMPLLFEIGADKLFDMTVLVYAPIEKRVERLRSRGMTEMEARARIKAQADESVLLEKADRIIDNSGSLCELKEKIRELFAGICNNGQTARK